MATLIDLDPARQLAAAEHDLAADFPSVRREHIHELVHQENHRYDAARIHDFVSILVAHTVRTRLLVRNESRRVAAREAAL